MKACWIRNLLAGLVCAIFAGCAGTLTPSHQDPGAYTHLDAAVESCDLAATRNLIDDDPELANQKGWSNTTPLYLAALNNCTEVAALLIEKGAKVNSKGSEDATPLHIAAQKGNLSLVKLLLSHGADPGAVDNKGRTPEDRARQWGHPDVAHFLSRFRK